MSNRYIIPEVSKSVPQGKPTAKQQAKPVAIPSYRPFPVEALPPVLREFSKQVAASVDCDVAFAALPALTVAGAAIGASVVAKPKRGWLEPPAIWACVVADSGTGKSPAMKDSSSQAFEIDRELREAYLVAGDKYKEDTANYNALMEAFDPSSGAEKPEKPPKPKREHFAVVDATIERLAEMLGDSPRGLWVVRDELAGWFGSFSRYKSNAGGTDVPNWLSLFDCGAIRVHRRTGEPRDIETDRAFAAVCGGIQPDILAKHLAEPGYVESGLAARILFAAPPKYCPGWTDAELDCETEQRFGDMLRRLRAIPFDTKKPTELRLEFNALAIFKRLNNEFAARAENVDGGPMSAVLPKAVRYALRFALIHHCVTEAAHGRDAWLGCISEEAMLAGETLSRWFVHEAERVYATIGEDPEEREIRRISELVKRLALRKDGTVCPRDLQRANRGQYPTAEVAEVALDRLAEAGLGTWSDRPVGNSGGRPTRVFTPSVSKPNGLQSDPTQPDTTPKAVLKSPVNSGASEVVSGFVGCRVEDVTPKSSHATPEAKREILAKTVKPKPLFEPVGSEVEEASPNAEEAEELTIAQRRAAASKEAQKQLKGRLYDSEPVWPH